MPKYRVARSIEIAASPQRVFDVIADFGTWTHWSPWLCCEPDAHVEVTPDAASVGSRYSWSGEIVGAGEIEHQRLVPAQRIEDQLRFLRPFRSVAQVAFDMVPSSAGTSLTWSLDAGLPWFMFWMMPMIRTMIGMDYDRGLKMLKELLETGDVAARTTVHGVKPVAAVGMIGVRTTTPMAALGDGMKTAFEAARKEIRAAGLSTDGDPISVYHRVDMKTSLVDFTSGYLVRDQPPALPSALTYWSGPQGRALHVEHIGGYEHLGNAWSAVHQHARFRKLKPSSAGSYEIYRNCPDTTARVDLRTDVYLPLK